MTQGELEFLCGPWQKDRRRQDARRGETTTQRNSRRRGPERSSMARAQQHGPSAAKWPERRDMARAQRAPQQRARGALQSVTLKQRRGHRLDIARAHALTG